jgi:hypothetical protein
MAKYAKGKFIPKNPSKFVGTKAPTYRSSWEAKFMEFCDNHPNILTWASENVKIPYVHPLTGLIANYVPDFMVQYVDAGGAEHVELIEIKPASQSTNEAARSKKDKIDVAINAAKWESAAGWSATRGIRFKVINESQIFKGKPPRKKTPRIPRAKKPRKIK